jgi:hypothetical protein
MTPEGHGRSRDIGCAANGLLPLLPLIATGLSGNPLRLMDSGFQQLTATAKIDYVAIIYRCNSFSTVRPEPFGLRGTESEQLLTRRIAATTNQGSAKL